ncbi:MAG: hypothetical protein DME24_24490 [Verrucomicrobia bacterium]|nr:MAG: hypothetical protein DME24_24490 [Verrucomicrobiota bacterium]
MSLSQLEQRNWVRGGSYVRDLATRIHAQIRNSDCISLLYMVCVFWGKNRPSAANAELRKTLQPQGESKRAPPGKTPFLNYKTAAATLTSSVQQLCPQVVALNRHVYGLGLFMACRPVKMLAN